MHGRVLGLADIDKRGDELMAAVASGDTVLTVGDTADFEEDTSDGTYWLTIADTTPRQYVAVDHDANTVTLAAAAGATFEVGDPVDTWDPSVPPAGAKVAEYLVNVMTDRGPVPAVIDHETTGFAGVDNLVDASVSLTEDIDSVHVDRIWGRAPLLDQAVIDTPFISLYQAADESWIDSATFGPLTDWTVGTQEGINYSPVNGEIEFLQAGRYIVIVSVNWDGNTSGRRYIRLVSTVLGADVIVRKIPGSPPDAGDFTQQIVVGHPAVAGEKMRVEAHQTSGAGLILHGEVAGQLTTFQAVRVQA